MTSPISDRQSACSVVLHLSDLHFGGHIRDLAFRHAKQVAQDTRPDFIVVSGDLAENPWPPSLRKAAAYLKELLEVGGTPNANLLVVPGNHDYRIKGNVGLRRFTRVPFEVYFRSGSMTDVMRVPLHARLSRYLVLGLKSLWPGSRELRDRVQVIRGGDSHPVEIYGFNSTPLFEMFARGSVSAEQLAEFRSLARNRELPKEKPTKAKGGEWQLPAGYRPLRIAVVHHHPAPIPGLPDTSSARVEEHLMMLYNAGSFLRELSKANIDLVLHGHKHYAGFTRAAFDLEDGRHRIGILAAGSAAHADRFDPLGNNINLVTQRKDGTVEIQQCYSQPDQGLLPNRKHYVLNEPHELREASISAVSPDLRVGSLQTIATLTKDGYTEVETLMLGCTVRTDGGISTVPMVDGLVVSRPAYLRKIRLGSMPFGRAPKGATLDEDPDRSHLRECTFTIGLGGTRYPRDGPFDLALCHRVMNCHALNRAEFRRKYLGQEVDSEYATLHVQPPAEHGRLEIRFPGKACDQVDRMSVKAEATYLTILGEEAVHPEESHRAELGLLMAESRIVLDLPNPRPNYEYRVHWRYGEDQEPEESLQCGRLREGAKQLLATAHAATEGNPAALETYMRIQTHLLTLRNDVLRRFGDGGDTQESLQASIAVFEFKKARLRFVTTTWGGPGTLWKETFSPGEGCAGFAFEKSRILFYRRDRDGNDYYIGRDETLRERRRDSEHAETQLKDDAVLVAIPWCEPATEFAIGVLSLGSTREDSGLLRLFNRTLTPEEREVDRAWLMNIAQAFGMMTLREFGIGGEDKPSVGR